MGEKLIKCRKTENAVKEYIAIKQYSNQYVTYEQFQASLALMSQHLFLINSVNLENNAMFRLVRRKILS